MIVELLQVAGGSSSSSRLAESWVTLRGDFGDFGFGRVVIGMEDGWGPCSPIRERKRTLARLWAKKNHRKYKDARGEMGQKGDWPCWGEERKIAIVAIFCDARGAPK